MRRSLAGRSVVVTGAAGGLGAALARRFAAAGAELALLDVDAPATEALAAALRADGARALAVACDVASEEACHRAIEAVVTAHGGIDVLVNNAGITHVSAFAETDVTVIRRVMDVNFFGAVSCTRAALPSLLARRGRIVVISSVAGFAPLARRTGYCASKFALHGLFETLRAEHRRDGLGVTLVCPYFIDTNIGRRALDGHGAPAGAARPEAGRAADPGVVAEAIVRGLERGRRLILTPAPARGAYWLSRLAPRLYERQMIRRVLGR